MAVEEVIDLTASPPKVVRILKIEASTSSKKIQFKIRKSSQPSWQTQNPSPRRPSPIHPSNNHSTHTFDFYQITAGNLHQPQAQTLVQVQAQAQAQAQLAAAYKPTHILAPKAQEHQQFGRGRWSKIARHRQYCMLKKPLQQVQRRHGTSFLRHRPVMTPLPLPPTSTLVGPPSTLMLFPRRIRIGEATTTSSRNGLDKTSDAVAPNMPSNQLAQLDLELRLG